MGVAGMVRPNAEAEPEGDRRDEHPIAPPAPGPVPAPGAPRAMPAWVGIRRRTPSRAGAAPGVGRVAPRNVGRWPVRRRRMPGGAQGQPGCRRRHADLGPRRRCDARASSATGTGPALRFRRRDSEGGDQAEGGKRDSGQNRQGERRGTESHGVSFAARWRRQPASLRARPNKASTERGAGGEEGAAPAPAGRPRGPSTAWWMPRGRRPRLDGTATPRPRHSRSGTPGGSTLRRCARPENLDFPLERAHMRGARGTAEQRRRWLPGATPAPADGIPPTPRPRGPAALSGEGKHWT
jgi:hypothetical protein